MFKFFDKVKKSKAGYTLTELIVVVAILGILAAIGIPMIMNSRQEARNKADATSINVIEQTIQLCIADEKINLDSNNKIIGDAADISKQVKSRLVGNIFPENNTSGGRAWFLDAATGKVYTAQSSPAAYLVLS